MLKSILKFLNRSNYDLFSNLTILFLLFIGLFTDESSYLDVGVYALLRWFVMSLSIWTGYKIYKSNPQSRKLLVLAIIAILFNPIAPVILESERWKFIDIFVGLSLVWIIYENKILDLLGLKNKAKSK